jgi:hypothetical protein
MPKLLLNLRHVPEDEAEEVAALLDANAIEHYRTPPSNWGISAGGIWLADPADHPRARRLMDAYQAERAERARAEWQAAQREGRAGSLWSALRAEPGRVLLILFAILALVGLSTVPFVLLSR